MASLNDEILEKEKEFHKMNEELEKKTRSMIDKIKNAGSNYELKYDEASTSSPELSCFSFEENLVNTSNIRKSPSFKTLPLSNFQSSSSNDSLFLSTKSLKKFGIAKPCISTGRSGSASALKATRSILEGSGDNENIFQSQLSQEARLRLLNAKSTNLMKELQKLRADYSTIVQEFKSAQKEIKNLETEKSKNLLQIKTTKEQLRKQEEAVEKLTTNVHNRDAENRSLKKQLNILNQDLKKLKASHSNQTLKFNQLTLENEKLQVAIRQAEYSEKETRDTCRKKTDELGVFVKKQTKQISTLSNIVKKQLELIDNLKRQRTILENNCILQLVKDEFDKFLSIADEKSSDASGLT